MRKRFGQGRRPFHATLAVGVAVGLAGCAPDEPVPAQMSRAVYASQDACTQDWAATDCTAEEGAARKDGDAGQTGQSGTATGGGGVRYFGPFMHNGFYYPVGGGYRPLTSEPRHAMGVVGVPPSPQAAQSFRSRGAVTRGGLGSSAASHFGGG